MISNTMKDKLVAKAHELLTGYDGEGIDVWDAVMYADGNDGYDINVYQDEKDAPLQVIAYEVINLKADYSKWTDITEEVKK